MMEGCIKQNNGIDIYIEYFENQDEVTQCEVPQTKTVGQYLLYCDTIIVFTSLVVRTVLYCTVLYCCEDCTGTQSR